MTDSTRMSPSMGRAIHESVLGRLYASSCPWGGIQAVMQRMGVRAHVRREACLVARVNISFKNIGEGRVRSSFPRCSALGVASVCRYPRWAVAAAWHAYGRLGCARVTWLACAHGAGAAPPGPGSGRLEQDNFQDEYSFLRTMFRTNIHFCPAKRQK